MIDLGLMKRFVSARKRLVRVDRL